MPVILVPLDVLRDLLLPKNWSDMATAASQNVELRDRVNDQIAKLRTVKTLKDRRQIRRWALSDRDAFEDFLQMVRGGDRIGYDMKGRKAIQRVNCSGVTGR